MLADRQSITVMLFDQPFALGACRMAYHAMGQKDGQRCATFAHSTLHSAQHLCSICYPAARGTAPDVTACLPGAVIVHALHSHLRHWIQAHSAPAGANDADCLPTAMWALTTPPACISDSAPSAYLLAALSLHRQPSGICVLFGVHQHCWSLQVCGETQPAQWC